VGADVADELVRVGAAADCPTPRGPFPYIEGNRSPSELDASRRREGACNCACTSRPSSGSRSLARARWIAAGSLKNRSPSELDASRRREGACNCACTSRPSSGSRSLARATNLTKSWSLRADARRRITLYYQIQVSLQGTGFEPLGPAGLDPIPLSKIGTRLLASLGIKGKNRKSLACLRNAGSYSGVSYWMY